MRLNGIIRRKFQMNEKKVPALKTNERCPRVCRKHKSDAKEKADLWSSCARPAENSR